MKKKITPRTIFITACICLLVFSLLQIGLQAKDYLLGDSSNQKIEQLSGISPSAAAGLPSGTKPDPLLEDALSCFADCDFDALTKANDEIIAWIVIPGTNISYPVCQHADNQYYLEHTSNKEASRIGAIFADYRVDAPFEEFNSILYGHRLLNQTMFSALKTYQSKENWEKNPYIYICTPETVSVYEIYSAFRGDPDGISYDVGIHSEKKKQAFIDYSLSCAEYDTGIIPTTKDSFLTLSTCTGSGHTQRMIIHSVLCASAPNPSSEAQ